MRSLQEALLEVPDPRGRHGRRHPLAALLTLAVCAMLCGARSQYAIAQWGRDGGAQWASALGFRRGRTPSVATVHRVFRDLDREAFERCLGRWFQELGWGPEAAVALDGKTLRGIHGEGVPGVHLVSAYSHTRGVVVDQQATGGKGQELEAARALLERLPLQGCTVTGDAQFTQRAVCRQIVAKGGTIPSP